MIILTAETSVYLVIKNDYESELAWIYNFEWRKFAWTITVIHFGLIGLSIRNDDFTWSISQKIYVFWLDYFILVHVANLCCLKVKQRNLQEGLSEVQLSKSSNMEFEIWESRCHVNLWLPHAMIQRFTWYRCDSNTDSLMYNQYFCRFTNTDSLMYNQYFSLLWKIPVKQFTLLTLETSRELLAMPNSRLTYQNLR